VSTRPRLLVTAGRDLPERASNLRLPMSYVAAILSIGAIPVLIPPGLDETAVNDLVADVDGLLLPGGVDPHPRHFNEAVHPMTVIDEDLDALELSVIAAAMQAGLPTLGICRGSQILNVALGGTLIQHLGNEPIDHRPDGPLDRHIHQVQLSEGSRLRTLAGAATLHVNSWHHQAIGRVADTLRVAAVADDGVVEAIESADPDTWVVGVQYHPEELLAHPAHSALFSSFADSCRQGRRLAHVVGTSHTSTTTRSHA
jgi:putative glutamine amidotransferase